MTAPTAELEPTTNAVVRRVRGADRLAVLDSLRFVAALSVVLYHFTAHESRAWGGPVQDVFPRLTQVTRFGFLGVEMFFFISGFVILMTAWGRDVPGFVASRIGRLFPAYWAGVLLTGGLFLISGNAMLRNIKVTDVLTNLTMVQTAYGIRSVDGVYWTLWVELRFYLLVTLFALVGITRNRIIAFAVIWPVAAAMSAQYGGGFVGALLLPKQAPLFATGMLLYLAYREGLSIGLGLFLGFDLLLSLAFVTHEVTKDGDGTANPPRALVTVAIVVLLFLLVAAAALTPLRQVSWGWLTTLGALTYPLYVLHEWWGWYFISELRGHLSDPMVLALVVVLVLAMAALVHQLVEKPLGPRLRRWTLETFDRPPRAAQERTTRG